MEQQTKNCPYCGGEIMAAAKKCKHCGEWVTPREASSKTAVATEQADKTNELPEDPVKTNLPKYANTFYWFIFISNIFAFIHGANDAGVTHIKGKRTSFFTDVSSIIPEQLDYLLNGIGFVGLTILLMKLTKAFGKPLDALCISAAALYGIFTVCVMADADFMGALFIMPTIPLFFIIGIKLNSSYKNSLKSLGIAMIIWVVIDSIFIGISIENDLIDDLFWVEPLYSVVFGYIFATCLTKASNNPQGK